MMFLFLYRWLLRLHPARFRERFADEMFSIFERAAERREVAKLLGDGLISLVRQWTLRSEFWQDRAIEPEHSVADGVPIFYTFASFKPRTSALVDGGMLTVVVFCTICLALKYNWTHPVVISLPIQFETNSDTEPPASSRVLPSPSAELKSSEWQTISPRLETRALTAAPPSFGQSVFAGLQTPLSRTRAQNRFDAAGATSPSIVATVSPVSISSKMSYGDSVDSSPHAVRFIPVGGDVKLEVLDWGGSGRALVLLAGLENTAHIFDDFAPQLVASYHVYGITRRGFGASSVPADTNGNYSADRLGDDVLAVVDSLGLNRPVLVGHSIAGEELSSIGTRHPEKVAGLVYLDAGYSYAFYDRSRGDLVLDSLELRRKLEQLIPGRELQARKQVVQELLTIVPRFERTLRVHQKDLRFVPEPLEQPGEISVATQAIVAGEQKYTDIRCPILAIFAVPHNLGPAFQDDPVARAAANATDRAWTSAQARAFKTGLPSEIGRAHV
jgi:pimeloyl-ACP methyl ester carboxylesterase